MTDPCFSSPAEMLFFRKDLSGICACAGHDPFLYEKSPGKQARGTVKSEDHTLPRSRIVHTMIFRLGGK